jgi:hypothetical protein
MVPRIFLSFLLASEFLAAQNPPAPRLALCSVTGQVVLETTGTPLRKVDVTLVPSEGSMVFSNQEGREPQTTVTDSDGRFQFAGVPAGEYRVILGRNGFLSTNRRSRRYSPNLLSLAPGQELQGLLFRMRQAGVIKGKIVDEDGDPVPGITVYPRLISGRNESIVSDTTNDLGEFRIAGLPEGKFLVLAQTAGGMIVRGGNFQQQAVYAPTYYPGTLDQTRAASVEVHTGEESTANFNLISTRRFTVKGQVVGLNPQARPNLSEGSGRVVGGVQIDLQRAEFTSLGTLSTTLEKDGTFEFEDVEPGSYILRADSEQGSAVATIDVLDADVTDVQIAIEPSVEVRGRFRLDTGEKLEWRQVHIRLDPDSPRQTVTQMVFRMQADGSFRVQNVQTGNYHVVVTSSSSALRDYIVKEVNANGKDVGDSGFAVGNGAPYLDIVGSARGGTIEGVALDDQGKPVGDEQIVCIPDAARRKRHDVYQQVQTDQRGYFSLRGLNPGEYQVFALDDEVNDITDQDFVAAHEGQGETVKVEAGERKTVSLKLPAPQD